MVDGLGDLVDDVRNGDLEGIGESLSPNITLLFTEWGESSANQRCRLVGKALPEIIGLILLVAKGAQFASMIRNLAKQGLKPHQIMGAVIKQGVQNTVESAKGVVDTTKKIGRVSQAVLRRADDFFRGRKRVALADIDGTPRAIARADLPQESLSPEVEALYESGGTLVEVDGQQYIRDRNGQYAFCNSPCDNDTAKVAREKTGGPSGLGRIHPNLQPNGALRSTAKEVHSLAHPIKLKNQTVAIAEVRMPDGTRRIVASANTSARLPNNQRQALENLRVEIAPLRTTNGVPNHAEINIIQSLPEGARVERWGISSGRHQVPDPCSECIGPVQQIGGNLEGK